MKKNTRPPVKRTATQTHTAYDSYYMYGVHAIEAALHNKDRIIFELCHTHNTTLPQAASRLKPNQIQCVAKDHLNSLVGEDAVHQGIVMRVAPLKAIALSSLSRIQNTQKSPHIMVLDQVTDPHNVGAILRSCAVFGASALVMTERHTPLETGVLAKTASGALEHVPIIRITNLAQGLEQLKKYGFWTIGLAEKARQKLSEIDFSVPTAIVMGAEGQGLRTLTQKHCDIMAHISSSLTFSTLNVSNAAAVILYEAFCKKNGV